MLLQTEAYACSFSRITEYGDNSLLAGYGCLHSPQWCLQLMNRQRSTRKVVSDRVIPQAWALGVTLLMAVSATTPAHSNMYPMSIKRFHKFETPSVQPWKIWLLRGLDLVKLTVEAAISSATTATTLSLTLVIMFSGQHQVCGRQQRGRRPADRLV